jgi:hypothetical protein
VNLPSFLWLWRIAAWSMGLSLTAYGLLALTGGGMFFARHTKRSRPKWLRPVHIALGISFVSLILLLLSVGLVGTLGYYGTLGHSAHLPAGVTVVLLALVAAWSGFQIRGSQAWARSLHWIVNLTLFFALATVLLTGWTIVQKYLP